MLTSSAEVSVAMGVLPDVVSVDSTKVNVSPVCRTNEVMLPLSINDPPS